MVHSSTLSPNKTEQSYKGTMNTQMNKWGMRRILPFIAPVFVFLNWSNFFDKCFARWHSSVGGTFKTLFLSGCLHQREITVLPRDEKESYLEMQKEKVEAVTVSSCEWLCFKTYFTFIILYAFRRASISKLKYSHILIQPKQKKVIQSGNVSSNQNTHFISLLPHKKCPWSFINFQYWKKTWFCRCDKPLCA